jgi:hypothetical protein
MLPCRYLYGDLNGVMWSAYENPPMSGKYSVTDLPYKCSSKTPVPCDNGTALKGIISFGEDVRGDIFLLAVNGAYRMVNPSLCGITCTEELPPLPGPAPAPAPSTASSLFVLVRNTAFCLVLALCALVWLWSQVYSKWKESIGRESENQWMKNNAQSWPPPLYYTILFGIRVYEPLQNAFLSKEFWLLEP